MKMLCSLAAAAMIAFGASASVAEPLELSDDALDGVSAGFSFYSSAFTGPSSFSFGSGGSLFEQSTAKTTLSNGLPVSTSSRAKVHINGSGPGAVSASSFASVSGTFGGFW